MKPILIAGLTALFLLITAFLATGTEYETEPAVNTEWSLNATAIEACTCPMFCQCYFNTEPAAHGHDHGHGTTGESGMEHYCKFNMAWKVNKGHHGNTNLDGVLYWIAGDIGEGWADGTTDWAVLHFDPSVTEAQRNGVAAILGNLFPVEWRSFSVEADMPIEWKADSRSATAKLDNGRGAEMKLIHPPTAMSSEPVVLNNVHYWGAPRHDGFVLMPNEIQAYRTGEKAFESRGSNGFMITIDINSNDI
jgi:hypothetical protein